MRVEAASPADLAWVEERTSCVLTRQARGIKAVDASGRIRGMVAYDAWTPASVQAHMAVDTPIVWRSLVVPAFEYPFVQSDRDLVIGVIPTDNERSLEMAWALGFAEIERIQGGWSQTPRVDLSINYMRRNMCRWIQPHRWKPLRRAA